MTRLDRRSMLLALAPSALSDRAPLQPYRFPPSIRPPEFTGISKWINSPPLTLDALRGRVVVVHFWTFG